MIPSIANYFGVTIDELFGYQNDREIKIQEILQKTKAQFSSVGGFIGVETQELQECVRILRNAAEEFPGEPRILLRLATALYYLGWNRHDENAYCQEALSIYEKLLKLNLASGQREVVISNLAILYPHLGHYDKAKELAEEQTTIYLCREALLARTTTGDEQNRYRGELILTLLRELAHIIPVSVLASPTISSAPYGREVLILLITFFETICADGRCGQTHEQLRYLYLTLANLQAHNEQDMEEALTYFDKAFYHHKEYCRISVSGDYQYTAPLLEKVSVPARQFQAVLEFFWKYHMNTLPDNLKKRLREIDKYTECFE